MLHHITQRQKIIVMVAVMSGLFLVALDQTIIATALSAIVEDFNAFSSLGFVVTAYLLFSTVTVPIAGKMSDIFGRRPILMVGVGIFTLGSLLSGISGSIEQLIIYRALQGIGGGIIMANAFTIIGDLFDPKERGKWQGIIGAVFGLASVVGPLLGGYLTDSHTIFGIETDWRWTFYINVPIGILSALIIARYCPTVKHVKRPTIDYAGAAALAVALVALVLAVDNTDRVFAWLIEDGLSIVQVRAFLLGIFSISVFVFVMIERRAKQPIIPLEFFRNRTYTSVVVAAILFGAAFLGAILYLTQYNLQVYEASAMEAGLMLIPMVLGLVIASIVVGQVVSRTGRYKRAIIIGYSMACAGVCMLTLLGVDSPYWHEAIIMVIIGVGMGAGLPIMNLAVQNEFNQQHLGAATASTQLFRSLGSTVGTALFSGMLVAGVTAHMGPLADDPYIATLRQSPQAAQHIGTDIDANTALQLNVQSREILAEVARSIHATHNPSYVKAGAIRQFEQQQIEFKSRVTSAFAASLRSIFVVGGVLMLGAIISILFVKERPLRSGPESSLNISE